MKVQHIFPICYIASILVMVSCNDGAFNIHGGYYEVYKFNDETGEMGGKETVRNKWGESSATGNNRKEIPGTEGICWKDTEAYCKLKFVVSAKSAPNEEHYQIKGAKVSIQNRQSNFEVDTTGFGVQEAFNGVERFLIADGYMLTDKLSDWGYGYLYLFVNKTTRPSIADAFLVEKRSTENPDFSSDKVETGQKDPNSKEQFLSKFITWSGQWKANAVTWWKLYIALTKVVKHEVIYDEKVVTPVSENPIGSLTLENRGSEITPDDFAKIGSKETVTLQTSTSMETTFDFSIDVGSSVSLEVGFVSASVDVNLHAGYSSTEASSSTTTKAVEKTIEWPTKCPDGTRVTYLLMKNTDKYTAPIEFTFERNGVQWKERKTFEATVNNLKQTLEACCFSDTPKEKCKSSKQC